MTRLYAPFEGVPVVRTNPSTAEMIRYASNALVATVISFANELARLAARLPGVDMTEVVLLVTRWTEFLALGGVLHELGCSPLVVDGRRLLDSEDFTHCEGIGRAVAA